MAFEREEFNELILEIDAWKTAAAKVVEAAWRHLGVGDWHVHESAMADLIAMVG